MRLMNTVLAATFCLGMVTESRAGSDQVRLEITPVRSVLMADQKQMTWLRVGLTGFQSETIKQRAPVNLAIVLDKSGSMQGDKIEQARHAAIDALSLLNSDDIVSIITYDSTVRVLVPATKFSDRAPIESAIRGIQANGNTALFAGVSKGAAEIRKFLDKERVNRVILLSDGLANVGPSSPGELGSLGESLLKENISVSTLGLGLGYNEDLMTQLAGKSGGNHHFIEQASELADIFRREFDDVLSVVAQEIDLQITIPEGIRPVRVLGNDADINGQQIVTRMAQIYSRQKKHVVIELEIPATSAATKMDVATVEVKYTNMRTTHTDRLSGATSIAFSESTADVEKSLNRSALADVVALVSSEQSKMATTYLDQGNLLECRRVLKDNVDFLNTNAELCPADSRLKDLAAMNGIQLDQLMDVTSNTDEKANLTRKRFRLYQNSVDSQQRLAPPVESTPPTNP